MVLVSWSCLLGVQPASVDTPEPKDHDRILHGKPLSDQVSRYVVREDGRGVERMVMVLVSWYCLLGVQPASVVDTPEPKDHDRILHGKPLSDQVSGLDQRRVADLDLFYTVFWIAWILFIWFSWIRIRVCFGAIQTRNRTP